MRGRRIGACSRRAGYSASMSEQPGSDPFGDFQRWLMKAGARSITRDVADRVKSTIGGGRAKRTPTSGTTATTDRPDRRAAGVPVVPDLPGRAQVPGLGRVLGRVQRASSPALRDALAGLTRDAFSLFDAACGPSRRRRAAGRGAPTAKPPTPTWQTARRQRQRQRPRHHAPRPRRRAPRRRQPRRRRTPPPAAPAPTTPTTPDPRSWDRSDHGTVVGPGVGWPTVVHPKHEDDEAPDEGGDRQEGGQPGDGGPDGGTDQQVERTAE